MVLVSVQMLLLGPFGGTAAGENEVGPALLAMVSRDQRVLFIRVGDVAISNLEIPVVMFQSILDVRKVSSTMTERFYLI